MTKSNLEYFLKCAKRFVDEGTFPPGIRANDDLCQRAREGEKPCIQCNGGEGCERLDCYPYFAYFSYRWRKLQKKAGILNAKG